MSELYDNVLRGYDILRPEGGSTEEQVRQALAELERKGIIHKDGDYWDLTPRARELGPEGVLRIIDGEEADEEA
jgi:hypothetical protein